MSTKVWIINGMGTRAFPGTVVANNGSVMAVMNHAKNEVQEFHSRDGKAIANGIEFKAGVPRIVPYGDSEGLRLSNEAEVARLSNVINARTREFNEDMTREHLDALKDAVEAFGEAALSLLDEAPKSDTDRGYLLVKIPVTKEHTDDEFFYTEFGPPILVSDRTDPSYRSAALGEVEWGDPWAGTDLEPLRAELIKHWEEWRTEPKPRGTGLFDDKGI